MGPVLHWTACQISTQGLQLLVDSSLTIRRREFATMAGSNRLQPHWSPEQLQYERSWYDRASAQLIGEIAILEGANE